MRLTFLSALLGCGFIAIGCGQSRQADVTSDVAVADAGIFDAPTREAPLDPLTDGDAAAPDASTEPEPLVPIDCARTCPSLEDLQAVWAAAGADELTQGALRHRFAELERVQGYLCGDGTPVYSGTVRATDNRGDHLAPYDNGEISGDVIAQLEVQRPPPYNGHARLTMFSLTGERRLMLNQNPEQPERMNTSAVEPRERTVPAHRTYCLDCVDSYVDAPDVIPLRPFTASAIAGDWVVLFSGGTLSRVRPDDITVDHLQGLTAGAFDATETGLVRSFRDRIDRPLEPRPPDLARFDRCYIETQVEHSLVVPAECPQAASLSVPTIASERVCCQTQTPCETCDHPFAIETTCFE